MTLHAPERLPRAVLPHPPAVRQRRVHDGESRRAVQAGSGDRAHRAGIALSALLVLVIVCQRFSLPLGGFDLPLLVLVAHAAGAVLLVARLVVLNRLRTLLFCVAIGFCLLATYVSTWRTTTMSIASLALLVAIYAPWLLAVRREHRGAFGMVASTFVWTMVVLSVVGVGQMLAQVAGVWQWKDYLQEWVPEQFLLAGFNTSNPIGYLNPIHKATAFVVLEPSFLSQFCALALIVAVVRRAPAWQVVVLAAGLVATLSGTGIMLLAFGMAIVAVRAPSTLRVGYVVAGVLVLFVVFATPVSGLLLERTDEFNQQGSSGYMRFVQPYAEASAAMAGDPLHYLFGAGPGTADRLLPSARLHAGEAVVYTIPAKLVFEYGLIAGGLFVLFLLVAVLAPRPLPALPASLVFMTFLLSGALLQPHTAYLAWLLSSVWGEAGREAPRGSRPPTSVLRRPRAPLPDR